MSISLKSLPALSSPFCLALFVRISKSLWFPLLWKGIAPKKVNLFAWQVKLTKINIIRFYSKGFLQAPSAAVLHFVRMCLREFESRDVTLLP